MFFIYHSDSIESMFSIQHFIWLFISLIIITVSLYLCFKFKPSLKTFLSICCWICVISETIKMFAMIQLVPSGDSSVYYPFIEPQHLPLHLCSIQIIFIFCARFMKDGELKDRLLGFMYPTTIIGALFALALPSIFNTTITASQAFTHPIAYELFLYHDMLVVLGVYIYHCKKETFTTSYYFTTEAFLIILSLISLYANSMFATPVYQNGKLVSVEHVTNFFFTFQTPIGLALTEKWQWFVYILILLGLAFLTIGIAYIPVFIRTHKNKKSR